MPLTKDEIKKRYPLPAYNYRVEIDGETISFSQVSGLNMSFETTTYKESPTEGKASGPVVMRMPGQPSDITITLQKGMVREKSIPVFYKWINSTQLNLVEKKDIKVQLCDENGNPVIMWTVINAFPTSLEAPTFDATTNDVAIENMQLMADRIIIEEA